MTHGVGLHCVIILIISWFPVSNPEEFDEAINVIQALEVLLWEALTPAGLLQILWPRNRP